MPKLCQQKQNSLVSVWTFLHLINVTSTEVQETFGPTSWLSVGRVDLLVVEDWINCKMPPSIFWITCYRRQLYVTIKFNISWIASLTFALLAVSPLNFRIIPLELCMSEAHSVSRDRVHWKLRTRPNDKLAHSVEFTGKNWLIVIGVTSKSILTSDSLPSWRTSDEAESSTHQWRLRPLTVHLPPLDSLYSLRQLPNVDLPSSTPIHTSTRNTASASAGCSQRRPRTPYRSIFHFWS